MFHSLFIGLNVSGHDFSVVNVGARSVGRRRCLVRSPSSSVVVTAASDSGDTSSVFEKPALRRRRTMTNSIDPLFMVAGLDDVATRPAVSRFNTDPSSKRRSITGKRPCKL